MNQRVIQKVLFVFVLTASLFFKVNAATILIYHHVSDKTPKSTSVSTEQFKEHLELINSLKLTVVPLTTITDAIKANTPVDNNWVAITFDDGYHSVYDNALPLLIQYKFPFTVFVNPKMVGPSKLYLDWEQLAELAKHQGIIANHTMAHENLVQDGLTDEQMIDNILLADKIITEKLNQSHKLLAYPYGEYDHKIKQDLKKLGYVGFAQHSGAVNETSDILALSRFPANGIYANPKTLKAKLNSLPFNIKSITPSDTKPESLTPLLQVSLLNKDFYQSQLACFISGSGKPQKPEWTSKLDFKISSNNEIPKGRVKYNCTAPSISHSGRFYWMSKLWINL
jgi:peptidoglycan/xylan/chitin deacetylase (PgdA/CDA1 family)